MQAEKVLLVTVNVHETQAVLTAIKAITGSAPRTHPIEQRTYRNLGKIGSASVWHALSEMGTATVGGTLQTVDLAIRALNPTMVIAVGIAFGVNEEKQKIGDVLVSRHLMLYEPARISAGEVLPRGDKPHASARLINLFEGVAQTLSQEYPVRVGAILSGEKLIDNIDYRNSLVSLANEAIGGEMEGGGVYASCVEHKVDWIVIKSICDWADGNKGVDKEARQIEAANSSASFIAQALKEVFGGAHSPTPSETIITAATPSVDSLTAARVERVTPLLEVLATRFQQYRMMADHYFRYILNKVPKVEASFEGKRLEIDLAVLDSIGALQIYTPPALRRVLLRIRRIISCSWMSPQQIYYDLFLPAQKFPRLPVETAQAQLADLIECFLAMASLMANGEVGDDAFSSLLAKHNLDTEGNPSGTGALIDVARSVILEPEYFGAEDKNDAIDAYAKLAGAHS